MLLSTPFCITGKDKDMEESHHAMLRSLAACVCLCIALAGSARATGVVPATTAILMDERSGEAEINVTNTDPGPVLLITSMVRNPDEEQSLVEVSPQVTPVGPGETQLVRFMLLDDKPLRTEQMRRVVFEGLPQSTEARNVVHVGIRQNLPVIVRPRDLPADRMPWKHLTWSVDRNALTVCNPSRYIVRLDRSKPYVIPLHQAELSSTPTADKRRMMKSSKEGRQTKPEGAMALAASEILPGQKITLSGDSEYPLDSVRAVRMFPAGLYGSGEGPYDAPVHPLSPESH
jgi:P pilus assembly chaperone PapD